MWQILSELSWATFGSLNSHLLPTHVFGQIVLVSGKPLNCSLNGSLDSTHPQIKCSLGDIWSL